MIIGIILFILLLALCILTCFFSYKQFDNSEKTKGIICMCLVIILGISTLLLPFSFRTVDTGEIAVVKRLGEAKYTRTSGTHFDFWITKSYLRYDIKVQNVKIKTMTYSSDAQTMDIQMVLQYQIMADKAIKIAQQYGSLETLESRIKSIAIEKSKAVLSAHKAMNIIADRAAMSPAVEQAIKSAIGNEYFVNVIAVVLTNIDFSDTFETAVEEKMVAEQKQLKSEYENQTKIARAEADAKSKILAAEAEAKANNLIENSITDKILKKQYIEKWNGELPKTIAGDDSSIMIPAN